MTQKLVLLYYRFYHAIFDRLRLLDGLAPLLLRWYLAPTFWMAGSRKIDFSTWLPYSNVVAWFGNPDWGLGMPMPTLMAFLAGWSEVLGAICLTLGLAVRWISIPLMMTMLVAAATVHWENGWQVIADKDAPFANERVIEATVRLEKAEALLQQYGDYSWLTENGSFAIINNGIELAVTYFIMLLTLFFIGGGRYVSVDYWLAYFWPNSRQRQV